MAGRPRQLFDMAVRDLPADNKYVKDAWEMLHGGGAELALDSLLMCLEEMEHKPHFWWEEEANQIVAEYTKPRR